jgi:hypothetical protein
MEDDHIDMGYLVTLTASYEMAINIRQASPYGHVEVQR